MSRAFLKNESADDPVVIPARAPLPPGVANYVTPRGLTLLRAELAELDAEHAQVQRTEADETERTRQLALINGKVGALHQRIRSAQVVNPGAQPPHEIRFGAAVTLRPKVGPDRQLTIVGVDEADAANGLIAFTAPIAKAMQGKRIGDIVPLRTMKGEEAYQVVAIR
ncbi:GreA/GreB family elongation factor [Fibrella forsythiae]|uniref:GreA/GreB family elongation factor n=1 Tax=Fibrella forsythiae TaxID=2817061 RepID=A0ABS3JCP4_9BACT|nr:GreA/GreB family elongation factor [Fibrella forsythiae]MBO0947771.1 GreA/GreB family elongation factor [Fibrella forsythiae]